MRDTREGGAPAGSRRAIRAFAELGKLRIVELWLGFFVALSLLRPGAAARVREQLVLGSALLATMAVAALTCCLDDIVGKRDGVDEANHRGRPRWGVEKPLLEGRLSEAAALRFALALAAIAVLGIAATVVLAWPLPAWVLLTVAGVVFLAVSYSSGPKLSYRGAGELSIFAAGAGTVLIPHGLFEPEPTWSVLLCAALVGSWQAQVILFSNSQDAAGDRAAGRRTLAARVSPRHNRWIIAGVFAAFWALPIVTIALGAAPAGYAVALAPVWALQGYQLACGVGRGDWLRARYIGFRVVRVGIAALVLANLVLEGGL